MPNVPFIRLSKKFTAYKTLLFLPRLSLFAPRALPIAISRSLSSIMQLFRNKNLSNQSYLILVAVNLPLLISTTCLWLILLPGDVDLKYRVKKYYKHQIDTSNQDENGSDQAKIVGTQLFEPLNNTSDATQVEKAAYISPSERTVQDCQLSGSHTRTERELMTKKQFSPEQKGFESV